MPRGRARKDGGALVRSAELIGWALGGLEREIGETRNRLASLTAQAVKLRRHAGRTGTEAAAAFAGAKSGVQRQGRKMSAEGRKRIADAAKRRWAKWRAENKNR